MSGQRRPKGTGALYFATLTGSWAYSVSVGGAHRTRKVLTRRRLCHLLRLLKDQGVLVTEPVLITPRAEALRKARLKGSHSDTEWSAYVASVGGVCEYCGRDCGSAPTKDHRTPLSRGGSDGLGNLAVACYTCNQRKATLNEAEFREWLAAGGLAEILALPTTKGARQTYWQRRTELANVYLDAGYSLADACRMAAEDQGRKRAS